jgi:hypothetical protein
MSTFYHIYTCAIQCKAKQSNAKQYKAMQGAYNNPHLKHSTEPASRQASRQVGKQAGDVTDWKSGTLLASNKFKRRDSGAYNMLD